MPYAYSSASLTQRATLHPHLREILDNVLITDDHAIIEGVRSRENQLGAFHRGHSKVDPRVQAWPHMARADGSSWAADVVPCIRGQRVATDAEHFGGHQMAQFAWFLRKVKDVSIRHFDTVKIINGERWRLRLGVDWDDDGEILTDQTFQDWFHIELVLG